MGKTRHEHNEKYVAMKAFVLICVTDGVACTDFITKSTYEGLDEQLSALNLALCRHVGQPASRPLKKEQPPVVAPLQPPPTPSTPSLILAAAVALAALLLFMNAALMARMHTLESALARFTSNHALDTWPTLRHAHHPSPLACQKPKPKRSLLWTAGGRPRRRSGRPP